MFTGIITDVGTIDRDRAVRLRTEGLEHTPPVVIGDEARLRQVLGNLMSNARRYTPPGSPITVRVAVEDSEAVLDVIDNGPGLEPEHARRVFERFYRADTARDRAHGGSGIGLAIAKALVEAHGGSVHVHSAGSGQGTTFRVSLPTAGASG